MFKSGEVSLTQDTHRAGAMEGARTYVCVWGGGGAPSGVAALAAGQVGEICCWCSQNPFYCSWLPDCSAAAQLGW
jgi:hypothetical protein